MVSSTASQFIHLHLHSAYSLAEGALPIKEIPKLCRKNRMPAVAITDTANLFGALEFALTCSEEGIQPIIGCQLNFYHEGVSNDGPIVLLVQNEEGYKNLLRLVSFSYLRNPFPAMGKPVVTLKDLQDFSLGLICLTGGHKGPLGLLIGQKSEFVNDFVQSLKTIFHDRLYIELMRHGLTEQQKLEPKFLSLALAHNIPIVATNDVFFENTHLYQAHDALLCIAEGKYISEENRTKATPEHYFKSGGEMEKVFCDLPEAIENTSIIAQRCHFMPAEHSPILPPFVTKTGCNEEEELYAQAKKGLEKRLEEEVCLRFKDTSSFEKARDQYFERLNYELDIISRMGFSGYFLIVADFIQWAKSQNIPVGPGRGSGAGSLVAWSLTITDMDPIHFNLIFERFLNPERVSLPDFDVDFCQERRDEVIQYVRRKYGEERVAHIITFGKLQARAVLRDVGRVLQMPYGQVDRLSKMVPNNPAHPVTLEQAIRLEPLLKQQSEQDETVANLIDISIKLEGLYRHASTHAAGVVIGDRDLVELVPLYKDERSLLPATQFSMKYVEAAGLLKFDFLGLKTLTVIERCSQLIRQKGGSFQISTIPLDDLKTFNLLCRVEVVGVFQVESGGMRDVLRRLRPDRFEDIVALVALFRPGPMDDIPRYLACKHGEEQVRYLHPELKSILEPTYGVMVYQEQVMKIAQVLGGYTLGAADLLRRAMGKKIKSEMNAQRDLFVAGAIEKGIEEGIATQIFEQMAKFAGYGFNKSHSAPYALLTYQTAYLKANYPLEFFAATMTYDLHNMDKLNIYRQDLLRAGICLYPPDVNFSQAVFSVENDGIRYGLSAIKNVGLQAMESLVCERSQNGLFKDLSDFISRVDSKVVNKRQLENLIAAGAFDTLASAEGYSRQQVFEGIDTLIHKSQIYRQEKNQKQVLLFGQNIVSTIAIKLPSIKQESLLETLQKEFDALGFYLSAHPLDIYEGCLSHLFLVSSDDLLTKAKDNITAVNLAGIVLSKQERASKTGQKFAFVSLSDRDGTFEVAFFSEVYNRYRDLLNPGTALFITASLRAEGEAYKLIAQNAELLEDKARLQDLVLNLGDDCNIERLKDFFDHYEEGKTQVVLNLKLKDLPSMRIVLPKRYALTLEQRSHLLSLL